VRFHGIDWFNCTYNWVFWKVIQFILAGLLVSPHGQSILRCKFAVTLWTRMGVSEAFCDWLQPEQRRSRDLAPYWRLMPTGGKYVPSIQSLVQQVAHRYHFFVVREIKGIVKNWIIKDIFQFNSNQDCEEDILLLMIPPGGFFFLERQQCSSGNCCCMMLTSQGLGVSKTLLILSKYTKHIAIRKLNLCKVIMFGHRLK
jgi:hypothetical protein